MTANEEPVATDGPKHAGATQQQPPAGGPMHHIRRRLPDWLAARPVAKPVKAVPPTDPPVLQLHVIRAKYADIQFLEAKEPVKLGGWKWRPPPEGTAAPAYYVEVSKRMTGWSITVHRGPDKDAPAALHLRKNTRWLGWDKATKVNVQELSGEEREAAEKEVEEYEEAQAELELQAAQQHQAAHRDAVPATAHQGDSAASQLPLDKLTLRDSGAEGEAPQAAAPLAAPETTPQPAAVARDSGSSQPGAGGAPTAMAKASSGSRGLLARFSNRSNGKGSSGKERKDVKPPAAVMTRLHEFRNTNAFQYRGRTYVWDYVAILGAKHTCWDAESGETVAVCQLAPTWTWQIVSDWGLRLNGVLDIFGSGKDMVDMLVATLTAILEWRKHNNKVWIVAAAIA